MPGLLLGGEEKEGELHKGKLVGGPCSFRGSLPSREGQGAPRFPGRNHTLSPAVCCPLSPATGVVAASPHSSCHLVCWGPFTSEDSSFQQPSVCSLPMGSLPKQPPHWPSERETSQKQALFCSLLWRQWCVVGVQEIARRRTHGVPSTISLFRWLTSAKVSSLPH